GRGLGTELLARLSARARSEGIHRFTALVAEDNVAMAGLLRNMRACLAGRSPGTVEYEITLTPLGAQAAGARRVPRSTLDSSGLPWAPRGPRQASSFSGRIRWPSYRSCT